jgi:peptidoglycan biosynthesis protein MviN/MurJ (putative lipid II flippase)
VVAVSLSSVILNVSLGVVLVRAKGAAGAAMALAAAQLVVGAVYYTLAKRYGGAALSWREWRTIVLSFGAALLGVGLVRGVLPAMPLLALLEGCALCAGLYGAVLVLQGGISVEEKNAVRILTRKLLLRAA